MRPADSVEDWVGEVMAERATRGHYMLFRGLIALFIKLCTVQVIVFLRYRVGARFISIGTIFWAFSLHLGFFFWEGLFYPGSESMRAVLLFTILFIPLGVWRMIEARWNLYRRNSNPRHGADMGRSYLWFLCLPLLVRIKLAPSKGRQNRWWQLNEWRWQRFIEPVLIFQFGSYLQDQSYIGFGGLIQVSAVCCFIFQQTMVRNFYRLKQKMIDSQTISRTVNQSKNQTPRPHTSHTVFERPLRDKSDFDNWQKEQSQQTPHY